MALRWWRRMAFGVLAGLLVIGHVLMATVGVMKAAQWVGGIALGVLVAFLITFLVAAHVAGFRRLAARRRQIPVPAPAMTE